MAKKETQKEKIARLEQEVAELKKSRDESWLREQEATRQIIALQEGVEEQFKQTPLYIQMQREISNLKAENALNKVHKKAMEEIRYEQAERIAKLEESLKNKNDTDININIDTKEQILIEVESIGKEELKKIEIFNSLFAKHGVYLEVRDLKGKYIKIDFDTKKNKRGAGRKQKFVSGSYTLKEVEEMLKTSSAEEVANELGVSRATFFRKLKKSREWGDQNERFL